MASKILAFLLRMTPSDCGAEAISPESLFSVYPQSALPLSAYRKLQETAEPSIYLSSGFLSLNTVDILGQIIPRCGGGEALLGMVGCLTGSRASSQNYFPRSMTVPGHDSQTCLRSGHLWAKSSPVENNWCSLLLSIHSAKPSAAFHPTSFLGSSKTLL